MDDIRYVELTGLDWGQLRDLNILNSHIDLSLRPSMCCLFSAVVGESSSRSTKQAPRLANARVAVKQYPCVQRSRTSPRVEAAFNNWEALQKAGRELRFGYLHVRACQPASRHEDTASYLAHKNQTRPRSRTVARDNNTSSAA